MFRHNGIYRNSDDRGGGGGGDNNTIRQLRTQIDSLTEKVNKAEAEKTDLAKQLQDKNRKEMDEVARLNDELTEAKNTIESLKAFEGNFKTLQEQQETVTEFLMSSYETTLAQIEDEEMRATVKELTFSENDPITSIKRLEAQFKLLNVTDKTGKITNPTKGNPPSNKPEEKKYDPKTVGMTAGLQPMDKIREQINSQKRVGIKSE